MVRKNGEVEFRKTSYSTKTGQIPIKINIEIPDSAFKDPILEGTLKITEEDFQNTIKELEFELKRLQEND